MWPPQGLRALRVPGNKQLDAEHINHSGEEREQERYKEDERYVGLHGLLG